MDYSADALIAEHVRRLLEKMNVAGASVACDSSSAGDLKISIQAPEHGSVLIGAQGAHLHALQHVIRCVLRRHLDTATRITVDVNGYRARREKSLIGLAEEVARKAQKTGRPVTLSPMNAIDRRAIHTALATHKEVQTESVGSLEQRRVVVRPIFL